MSCWKFVFYLKKKEGRVVVKYLKRVREWRGLGYLKIFNERIRVYIYLYKIFVISWETEFSLGNDNL